MDQWAELVGSAPLEGVAPPAEPCEAASTGDTQWARLVDLDDRSAQWAELVEDPDGEPGEATPPRDGAPGASSDAAADGPLSALTFGGERRGRKRKLERFVQAALAALPDRGAPDVPDGALVPHAASAEAPAASGEVAKATPGRDSAGISRVGCMPDRTPCVTTRRRCVSSDPLGTLTVWPKQNNENN